MISFASLCLREGMGKHRAGWGRQADACSVFEPDKPPWKQEQRAASSGQCGVPVGVNEYQYL